MRNYREDLDAHGTVLISMLGQGWGLAYNADPSASASCTVRWTEDGGSKVKDRPSERRRKKKKKDPEQGQGRRRQETIGGQGCNSFQTVLLVPRPKTKMTGPANSLDKGKKRDKQMQ
jgi:hypothetical protein